MENQKFTRELSSPSGRLIGMDSSYYYFYENRTVKKYASQYLQRYQDSQLTFYISSFEEQCHSCKESFFNIHEWTRIKNIPYQFIVKDNSWFSSPDEDDYREVVDYMSQWNTWGAVSIEDECDDCFDGGLNVRINDSKQLISLPASRSEIESRIACE